MQSLLHLLALGNVTDGTHHQRTVLGFQRAQADLYREFTAVLAQAVKFQSGPHGSGTRLGKKIRAVTHMSDTKTFRQQYLDELSTKFALLVTEESFGLTVGQHDPPARIGHDNAVRRRFEKVTKLGCHKLRIAENFQTRYVL